jgi:hypothetical protein
VSEERRRAYATAFHVQASSDWSVYRLFVEMSAPPARPLPACHSLHYLQMACEKLAKAYRLLLPGVDIDLVATRHVGFTQFVNTYVRSPAMLAKYANKTAAHQTLCRTAAAIAREIEKLAPATDRVSSPENAEYPWERGDWSTGSGSILVPCQYAFPSLSLLTTPGGRAFLKLVDRAFLEWRL